MESELVSQPFQFELLAHPPNQKLVDHLCSVANSCAILFKEKQLSLESGEVAELLPEICYMVGALHDIGKATAYFQEYIRASDESRSHFPNDPRRHHSALSSLLVYYFASKMVGDAKSKEYISKMLPSLAYLAVKKHHSNLYNRSLGDETKGIGDIKDTIREQLRSMRKYEPELNEILHSLLGSRKLITDCSFPKEEQLENTIDEIVAFGAITFVDDFWPYVKGFGKEPIRGLEAYFFFMLIYSILLFSDRQDASEVTSEANRPNIRSSLVDAYLQKMPIDVSASEMNSLRSEVYEKVVKKAEDTSLEQRVYSLNVPTGSGKTLSSFSFALRLRERIRAKFGYTPRIIYSLPFITIIEQNYEVLSNVLRVQFQEADTQKLSSDILLAHHHLCDLTYSTPKNEYGVNESEFLIESWSSEVIVTTFVQFFHSIISDNRGMSVKFHNIVNSIVILDEVQSLPYELWEIVRYAILFLSNVFRTYFVLTTATLPLILTENEIEEVVEGKQLIYSGLHRVELSYDSRKSIPLLKAVEQVYLEISSSKAAKVLIVLNTLNEWLEFAQSLETRFEAREKVKFIFLSSAITPKERRERIEEVKSFKPNEVLERLVVVSTQVIEAGVDLDFDMAFRDIGPLPSVIQICGRCNRNWKSKTAYSVRVFDITADDSSLRFADSIYRSYIIDKTKQVFGDNQRIEEGRFLELSERFYGLIRRGASRETSTGIISCLSLLDFRRSTQFSKYRLIDEEDSLNYFVMLDKNAKSIWSTYLQCVEESKKAVGPLGRFLSFRESFAEFKPEFYKYVVSLPIRVAASHGLHGEREANPFILVETADYSEKFGLLANH